MISKRMLLRYINEGEELCGVCGKVITGKPDCIHWRAGRVNRSGAFSQMQTFSPDDIKSIEHSLRVGEELLLYSDEYIDSLECLDRPSGRNPVEELYLNISRDDRRYQVLKTNGVETNAPIKIGVKEREV